MMLLDHVVVQAEDLTALGAWYDRVTAVIGGRRTVSSPALIGYGGPDGATQLWFSTAADPGGRQTHIALSAPGRAEVDRARHVAVSLGSEVLHEPREWPEYTPGYYAVFVRDPAGNNLEVVCHSRLAGAWGRVPRAIALQHPRARGGADGRDCLPFLDTERE